LPYLFLLNFLAFPCSFSTETAWRRMARYYPVNFQERLRKIKENPVRIADVLSDIQTEHLPNTILERYIYDRPIYSAPLTFYCFLNSCLHYVINFYYIPLFLLSSLSPSYFQPFFLSALNSPLIHIEAQEKYETWFFICSPSFWIVIDFAWVCPISQIEMRIVILGRNELYNTETYSTFHIVRNKATNTNHNSFTERQNVCLINPNGFCNFIKCKRAHGVWRH
jgi:hypothetical protein